MPIGELQDMIALYLASEGLIDVRENLNSRQHIPRELR